ncbi:MAG: ABC transporter permease, partial [Desulfovibrio sp.]|nr:ABC transporter permease [Desulfovibrio sp.]
MKRWICAVGPLIVTLCLWQFVTLYGTAPGPMRISPLQVGAAFWELCAVGLPPGYLLPMHTLYSLSKVLAGVLLAVLLGCP